MPTLFFHVMRRACNVAKLGMISSVQRTYRKGGLLLVNTATCSALYAFGDACCQKLEKAEKYDWARTARMALLGFVFGPINHSWYVFLDRRLPGRTLSIVLKKVTCDQLFMAPFCSGAYFIGMGLLEGKNMQGCKEELSVKFWPTYKMDWAVWPPAQVFNFYKVPPHLRVIYVNVVTLCWTVFLSYMKHNEEYDVSSVQEYDVSSVQEYDVSSVQKYDVSSVQEYDVSSVREYDVSKPS